MAKEITERVASGAYASESEVIRDGLRALFAQEQAVERWLHADVAMAYDELKIDPTKTISSKQLRAHLADLHESTIDRAD